MGSSAVPIYQHNQLIEKQGGTTNEYYHITSAQKDSVVNYLDQSVKQAASPTFAAIKITTAPTDGHVLTSDASGNGSWQASAGGGDSINHFLLIGA